MCGLNVFSVVHSFGNVVGFSDDCVIGVNTNPCLSCPDGKSQEFLLGN